MMHEINRACKRLNETLGIPVTLPEPGEKALMKTAACHFAAGVGLLAAGGIFASKWCVVLGGVSLASSAALRLECRNKKAD